MPSTPPSRPPRRIGESRDQLADLAPRERARLDVEARRRHGGGATAARAAPTRSARGRRGRAAGRAGRRACGRRRRAGGRRARSRAGSRRWSGPSGGPSGAPRSPRGRRRRAAAGPRLLVGEEVVGRHVVVHEARLVRRRHHPVAQLDRPELDRRRRRRVRVRSRAGMAPRTATASISNSIPWSSSVDRRPCPPGTAG